ncbi:DUF983 domain-containing protein [Roseomonas populi]|uniref:DUF983 domain-containing protein n=1 Tax=Roseomonas populi TaxID=3121582 RepID=A0ABT1XBM5_9PROT|nr:DUF983 domain-containing protein [Roseomonas pecuniae]MCR0985523.1 DUF983 domain-containing protein [Roseomonas pecuniae]
MSEPSKISTGLRRGFSLRCPQCGEGRLFSSFLKVSESCEVCGGDNTLYPSDDAPPYLTLFLVGHLIVPFVFWMDKAWEPALWVMFAIWLPLIGGLTLATLPYMKGATVGFAWATGVTRETARQ